MNEKIHKIVHAEQIIHLKYEMKKKEQNYKQKS